MLCLQNSLEESADRSHAHWRKMALTDVFAPKKRHTIMSSIRVKDTGPEIVVRKLLHSLGYRFRLHAKKLPGKPDIVLHRHRKVVFVNGCFWHGHRNCSRASLPKTNTDFWQAKISKNSLRDRRVLRQLRSAGWSALTVWQCQIGNHEKLRCRLTRYLQ